MKVRAVILAGGGGSRLWPLSRSNSPKQFLGIFGHESLFQRTLKRTLQLFSAPDIFIITSFEYRFRTFNQIDFVKGLSRKQKFFLKKNILFEPAPRSTLGAVLFVLKNLEVKCQGKEVFVVFPSDHIISPLVSFRLSVKKGIKLAKEKKIVALGVRPSGAISDYGYILPQPQSSPGGIFAIKTFVEKPSVAKARALIKEGALWNCGIFCFRKDVFENELEKVNPLFFKIYQKDKSVFNREFSSLPVQSLDYGLMEKTSLGWGVRLEGEWSDLGTWESFFSFFPRHQRGKYKTQSLSFLNAHNCEVWADKLVVAAGVKDLLVVDSTDALLLLKKGKSSYVKEIVRYLGEKKYPEVNNNIKVWRPWGYYMLLQRGEGYKVKEIFLYPHKCLSLQRHKYRSEHWNIVEGTAKIILGRKTIILRKNRSIFVKRGQKHKLCNPSSCWLRIIEVQIGNYLEEDDIERFDSY